MPLFTCFFFSLFSLAFSESVEGKKGLFFSLFLSLLWSMAAGGLSRTLSEAANRAAAEMQAAEEKVCLFVF